MRKIAFGYSTRCNLKCAHCVATEDISGNRKMDLADAKKIIIAMGQAGVGGISFSAGEPFLYFDEILELVQLCGQIGIYTRIVTNSYWAKSVSSSDALVLKLKENGLCQLRLSCSRWHQKSVDRTNLLNAANSCRKIGLDYFVSFVTDFSRQDDLLEQFLRDHSLLFFPEPVIYSGRARALKRMRIRTDYQANRCDMNPYITPDLDMYACCDTGAYFTETNFFHLGSIKTDSIDRLFTRSETDPLYNLIRSRGLSDIASFTGMKAREIITCSKCELCLKLFNNPDTLARLKAGLSDLQSWHR